MAPPPRGYTRAGYQPIAQGRHPGQPVQQLHPRRIAGGPPAPVRGYPPPPRRGNQYWDDPEAGLGYSEEDEQMVRLGYFLSTYLIQVDIIYFSVLAISGPLLTVLVLPDFIQLSF